MSKNHLKEAAIVDLDDESLKTYLLYTHEALKNLHEEMKNDEVIEQMQSKLKEYKSENYTNYIKDLTARLKAARAQASVRGIKIRLPEDR